MTGARKVSAENFHRSGIASKLVHSECHRNYALGKKGTLPEGYFGGVPDTPGSHVRTETITWIRVPV
jgi:hypothetical protein